MRMRTVQARYSQQNLMQTVASAVSVIRAFKPECDLHWLYALWQETMPSRWALLMKSLQNVLADARVLLVAERHGIRVGFCAADHDEIGNAGLLVVLVEPSVQRSGVGCALLEQLEAVLHSARVVSLRLGAVSTGTYFWPGLPAENKSVWPFFQGHGWKQEESCADLVQDLAFFSMPMWVRERLTAARVTLRESAPHLRDKILQFEQANFPAWTAFMANELAGSGDKNLLVAQTESGEIVGSLLMKAGIQALWKSDTGVTAGSLNLVGVSSQRQRQGIGLALTARAMEVLRERGCARCYIQWTGLSEWYGKLGAAVWANYWMAQKAL